MGNRVTPQIPLGEAVRMMREEKRLTKTAVASRAGISTRWLDDVEAGKSNPTWSNLRRLAHGLRVELTELVAKVERVERSQKGF
jgi:transcriptional regulator with XRE-family HTH domain